MTYSDFPVVVRVAAAVAKAAPSVAGPHAVLVVAATVSIDGGMGGYRRMDGRMDGGLPYGRNFEMDGWMGRGRLMAR